MMSRILIFSAFAIGVWSAAITGAGAAVTNGQDFSQITRGKYLATAGDCSACHTDPKDGRPFAGGRAIETPFGTLLAPNLTPDSETGIGSWSNDDFVSALLVGKGKDGMHLYPAMPYPYFTKMKREDALAIRAYLTTLDPVRHQVDANQLPFPLNIRALMIGWNAFFFKSGSFQRSDDKSDEWNRGAYLVEGPGHCGACHTEKNFLGGDKTSRALQGGVVQNWLAPDLTSDPRTGIGSWSVDDMVSYLRTGQNRLAVATGPMSEVIVDSTSLLSDSDLKAITAYLKNLPPSKQGASQVMASDTPEMRSGAALYADNCSACHSPTGAGAANLFPPLKDSAVVQAPDATDLIQVVLHGAQSAATDYAPTGASMPSLGWKLSDPQVAAVLNYVRNSWGNRALAVEAGQVHHLR
jgi:mono/diheme cytochrome c family protein